MWSTKASLLAQVNILSEKKRISILLIC
jgi:hypothetical protein